MRGLGLIERNLPQFIEGLERYPELVRQSQEREIPGKLFLLIGKMEEADWEDLKDYLDNEEFLEELENSDEDDIIKKSWDDLIKSRRDGGLLSQRVLDMSAIKAAFDKIVEE